MTLVAFQADDLDHLVHPGPVDLAALELQPEGHVVAQVEPRVEPRLLEDHDPVGARAPHRPAIEDDGTRGHRFEAGDQPQQRRLAAAARAQRGDELALLELQVHALEDRPLP
jgi:hypothetical protein